LLKPKIRVAICSSGAGHVFRGVEAWSYDMADLLSEKGVQCQLYVGGGRPSRSYEKVLWCLKRTSTINKVLVTIFSKLGGWRYGLGSEFQIEQLSFVFPLLLELNRNKVDIVHTHEFMLASYLQWMSDRGMLSAKLVYGHVTNEDNKALMKFDFVQHVSMVDMNDKRNQGCYKELWTAIPNFVDTDKFNPIRKASTNKQLRVKYGFPPKKLIFLTVAAIKREHKRIDWLIKEMVEVKKEIPDFLWVIVGGREKETEEIIAEGKRALGENVIFMVDLDRAILPEIYQCADCFVLGSLREMFGIVLIEAISSGLVTFVHDHPVLKYVVGEGGVVLDMKRHGNLVRSIRSILAGDVLMQQKKTAARCHAVNFFSKDAIYEPMINYYTDIVGRNRGCGRLKN
jgi:1,2-diacylglycerol 3-alpha-glucosyltransferase